MDLVRDGAGNGAPTPTSLLRDVVAAPVRPRTYRNLLYLGLQFPLGIVYFVALVLAGSIAGAGVSVLTEALPDLAADATGGPAVLAIALAGLVLLVVGIGLVLVGVVGLTVGGVALFTVDRLVTGALLGQSMPASPVAGSLREDPAGFLRAFVTSPGTYLATLLAFVKFPLGIAVFVVTFVPAVFVLVSLSAPLLYDSPTSSFQVSVPELGGFSYVDGFYTVDSGVVLNAGTWTIDTFPESIAFAGIGVVSGFVALNAFNLLAWSLGRATAVASRYATVFAVGDGDVTVGDGAPDVSDDAPDVNTTGTDVGGATVRDDTVMIEEDTETVEEDTETGTDDDTGVESGDATADGRNGRNGREAGDAE